MRPVGVKSPLVFSALEHTFIDAAELIPNGGGAAAIFDNDNDQDTPLVLTATLKSWRLRVAGAAWLPRYSHPCRCEAPSTRALLVKPGSERPFLNSVSRQ